MPVYTYRCTNCGVQFDQQQSFSDQPLTRCPECGKKTLKKVYQPVGIVFKGSGFYQTDYRSESYKSGEKKESEASKPAATADSGGKPAAESKPATDGASSAKPSKSSKATK